jgi:hypothetical protein
MENLFPPLSSTDSYLLQEVDRGKFPELLRSRLHKRMPLHKLPVEKKKKKLLVRITSREYPASRILNPPPPRRRTPLLSSSPRPPVPHSQSRTIVPPSQSTLLHHPSLITDPAYQPLPSFRLLPASLPTTLDITREDLFTLRRLLNEEVVFNGIPTSPSSF